MARHWPFTLRLGPGAGDFAIPVEFEHRTYAPVVHKPGRAVLDRVEPRWFAVAAALGIGGLVVLSVAAGSVTVAPPPPPTPLPGQATPTAGPPALRVGNLVIQAPVAARPASTVSTPVPVVDGDAAQPASTESMPPAGASGDAEPAAVDVESDTGGGFRLPALPFFQPPRPAPPAPPAPAAPPGPDPAPVADAPAGIAPEEPQSPVIPFASPAALPPSGRTTGPPRGSALEDALRTASVANDQFNRGLHEPVPNDDRP